jgi:hypothetical protein
MFTWDLEKCDMEIYEHGHMVMMCCIPNKDCNNFIEEISNIIGYKLDYSNAAGRNIIKCYAKDYDNVSKILPNLDKSLFTKYNMDDSGYNFY